VAEKQVRQKGAPAGLVIRLLAALYDSMIVFSLVFLSIAPLVIGTKSLLHSDIPKWVMFLLEVTIAYAYFVGFWVKSGTTTGMRPWKLQVAMAETGKPVSLESATLRFIGMLVTIAALGLPMITIFFTRQRQAFHDLLAGTTIFRIKP